MKNKNGRSNGPNDSVAPIYNPDFFNYLIGVLGTMDILYFAIHYLTAANRWPSVLAAMAASAINVPALLISIRTGKPIIKYTLTITLIPNFILAYYCGPDAPGWLGCLSSVVAVETMIAEKRYRIMLAVAAVIVSMTGCYLTGRTAMELAIILVILVGFTTLFIRVCEYLFLQNTKLEQASKIKGQFLANMSHEIRTPINGVLGTLQLLQETKLDSEQDDYLKMIRLSGQNLLAIINDILDLSKMEAGRLVVEKAPFNLGECMANCISILSVQASKKGLSLTQSVDPSICPVIEGDVTRLNQVLTNIVGNAIKFTKKGSITVEVKQQSSDTEQKELLFSIRDTGVGIPADRQAQLFEAFTQADASTTRKYGGTGLGLTISRQLVERMGGKMWLESEPGEGSTFYFTIATRYLKDAQITRVRTSGIDTQLGETVPLNILLAEDNPVNQKLSLRLLSKMGYTADLAKDGFAVLEALARKEYDLIFMDMQMPGMDGVEATQNIMKEYATKPRPKIVALTANVMQEDIDKCLNAGMDDYLGKPIQLEKLQEMIRKWGNPGAHVVVVETPRPIPSDQET